MVMFLCFERENSAVTVFGDFTSHKKVAVESKLCQDENNARKLFFLYILNYIMVRTNGFRSVFHARLYLYVCVYIKANPNCGAHYTHANIRPPSAHHTLST